MDLRAKIFKTKIQLFVFFGHMVSLTIFVGKLLFLPLFFAVMITTQGVIVWGNVNWGDDFVICVDVSVV